MCLQRVCWERTSLLCVTVTGCPASIAAAKPPSTAQAAAVSAAHHCLQDAKKRLEQQAREQAEKLRQEKLRQQQAKNKGRGRL